MESETPSPNQSMSSSKTEAGGCIQDQRNSSNQDIFTSTTLEMNKNINETLFNAYSGKASMLVNGNESASSSLLLNLKKLKTSEEAMNHEELPNRKLDDLHEYDLTHIFEFLSFEDRLNMGKVCKKFADFVKTSLAWRSAHLTFKAYDPYSLCEHKIKMAKMVSSLTIWDHKKKEVIDKLLQYHASHVKRIEIMIATAPSLYQILNFQHLHTLVIKYPIVPFTFSWDDLPEIRPKIKYLEFSGYVPCHFVNFILAFEASLKEVTFFNATRYYNCCLRKSVQLLPCINWVVVRDADVPTTVARKEFRDFVKDFPNTNFMLINIPNPNIVLLTDSDEM